MTRLTPTEKDIVIEALLYYRDNATTGDDGVCGVFGNKRKAINRGIEKINQMNR